MERLTKIIGVLEIEERVLKRIPTWPWQPEALRSVLATVLLPIIVWLAQQILQRFVP